MFILNASARYRSFKKASQDADLQRGSVGFPGNDVMSLLLPCKYYLSSALLTMYSLFSHKPKTFACWPCSSLPPMAAAPFHSCVLNSLLSRQIVWLCSGAEQQDSAGGDSSSRGHPLSVLPETYCHQHPVPAAAGDQMTHPQYKSC